jgi:acetyl esterase/lipase
MPVDDRAALVAALFGQEGLAAFQLLFNGRRYATQWARPLPIDAAVDAKGAEGGLAIESFLELDPTVLGEGGAIRRGRSLLVLDRDLRPVRYLSEVTGARLLLSLPPGDPDAPEARVRCHLPDGSVHDVPREGAAYVLEAYYPILDALMLWQARQRLQAETSLRVFLVNQLISLPYGLRPVPGDGGLRLRSSFSEDLTLDEGGRLLRSASSEHGVEAVRVEPPPPLPPWHERPWEAPPTVQTSAPAPAQKQAQGFRAEDVIIPAPAGPLGGTLTLPAAVDGERLPALLFWGGSGSYDRDGRSGELDLGFHETVDYLATCGFAGLRCDTRGAGNTPTGKDDLGFGLGFGLDAGLDAILSDARAAFGYLTSRPEIDPGRVFLIGQSQGCTIMLQLAGPERLPVRGVALLAPMGRPFDEVARDQVRVHGRQVGLSEEQIAAQLRQTDELLALVRDVPVWRPGEIPDRHYAQRRSLPWLRGLLAHPPGPLLQKVRVPVLICHGDRDFQVDVVKDAEALCAIGRAAGVEVRLLRFPGLDHLFRRVPEQGDSTLASYYDGQTRPVDPGFLAALAAWMRELAGGAPRA